MSGSYWTPDERLAIQDAGLEIDVRIQLVQLREQRGLTQAALAARVGTSQQAIARFERIGYDRHSLRKLREVAKALNAHVVVTLVPHGALDEYLAQHPLPVLDADAIKEACGC